MRKRKNNFSLEMTDLSNITALLLLKYFHFCICKYIANFDVLTYLYLFIAYNNA